jgi:ABC-type transport system involved in multi-copper enzyme maturation permease subunit
MTSEFFLFKTAFKDGLKIPLFLATLLPAAIALIWKFRTPEDRYETSEIYNTLLAYLVYGLLLTLFSLLQGTGVVAREVEQRTIAFLLTRPVSRVRIILSRLLGAWCVVTLYTSISVILLAIATYGTSFWKDAPLLIDLRLLPVGALVYCTLFTLLGASVRKPLLPGLLYVFGWEQITPNLPSGLSLLSIMAYLRSLAPHLTKTSEAVKDPTAEAGSSGMSFLMGGDAVFTITPLWAWVTLLGITLVAGSLACYVFRHRAYLPREEAT